MKFLLLHMTEKDLLEVLPPFIANGFSTMVRAAERKAIAASWLHQKIVRPFRQYRRQRGSAQRRLPDEYVKIPLFGSVE